MPLATLKMITSENEKRHWQLRTMWRRSTTMFRRTVWAVGRMRAWHVNAMRSRVSRLRRITQVRIVMVEADHVRVRGVAGVRVLIILRHQRHRHVTDRARIRLHVGNLAHDFRHSRHLWKEARPSHNSPSNSFARVHSTGFSPRDATRTLMPAFARCT